MSRRIAAGACRVCKCTDDHACEGGCWWVKTEPNSAPLCSSCAGTAADAKEALMRVRKLARHPIRNKFSIIQVAGEATLRMKRRERGEVLT